MLCHITESTTHNIHNTKLILKKMAFIGSLWVNKANNSNQFRPSIRPIYVPLIDKQMSTKRNLIIWKWRKVFLVLLMPSMNTVVIFHVRDTFADPLHNINTNIPIKLSLSQLFAVASSYSNDGKAKNSVLRVKWFENSI